MGLPYTPGLSVMVRNTVRGRIKSIFEAAGAKVIVPRQNILSGPLSLQTFVTSRLYTTGVMTKPL
jgi:hypothetical protein